jgi:hypothetical protein
MVPGGHLENKALKREGGKVDKGEGEGREIGGDKQQLNASCLHGAEVLEGVGSDGKAGGFGFEFK